MPDICEDIIRHTQCRTIGSFALPLHLSPLISSSALASCWSCNPAISSSSSANFRFRIRSGSTAGVTALLFEAEVGRLARNCSSSESRRPFPKQAVLLLDVPAPLRLASAPAASPAVRDRSSGGNKVLAHDCDGIKYSAYANKTWISGIAQLTEIWFSTQIRGSHARSRQRAHGLKLRRHSCRRRMFIRHTVSHWPRHT